MYKYKLLKVTPGNGYWLRKTCNFYFLTSQSKLDNHVFLFINKYLKRIIFNIFNIRNADIKMMCIHHKLIDYVYIVPYVFYQRQI